jgi:hypothetical protein
MLSWVLTSRDDNFGGNCEGVENYTMRRLEVTIGSIISLNVESEIIVVDFCPLPDRPISKYIGNLPVKIITVKPELLDVLKEDCPEPKMNFYEYVAKHIGSTKATGDYLILCNPDNIFPKVNFDEVIEDLKKGYIVRAVRCEIDRSYAKDTILQLVNMANKDEFEVMGRFNTAAGDFTAISKEAYQKLGGYLMLHGNWHLDNEFLSRAKLLGYEVSVPYTHYHLNHEESIINRATLDTTKKNTDFANFKPINKKIIEELDKYVA